MAAITMLIYLFLRLCFLHTELVEFIPHNPYSCFARWMHLLITY
jgi:hypothetical protein